jgi:hypothetical protein
MIAVDQVAQVTGSTSRTDTDLASDEGKAWRKLFGLTIHTEVGRVVKEALEKCSVNALQRPTAYSAARILHATTVLIVTVIGS